MVETPVFRAYAATIFTPALKRRLYGYKFYRRHEHLPVMTELLIHYWKEVLLHATEACHPEHTLVIPIPAHWGAESRVEAFAKGFARHFEYDYQPQILQWCREVQPQHSIADKRARFQNIAQSLRVSQSSCLHGYRHLLLIDDLTTTGATLREAVRALYAELTDSGVLVFGNLYQPSEQRSDIPKLMTLALASIPLGLQGN